MWLLIYHPPHSVQEKSITLLMSQQKGRKELMFVKCLLPACTSLYYLIQASPLTACQLCFHNISLQQPRAPKRHKSQHQCPNLSLCFHTNPYNPIFPLKPECIFEIVNQITSLPCLQASSAFTALKSKLYNASWRFPTRSSPCQLLGHHLLPLLILSTVLPSHEQAPCQGLWLFPSYMIPPMALKELERRRRRNNFRSA